MNEIVRIMRAGGYALEGLIYLLKEQKNTRMLLMIAAISLIICPLLGFTVIQTGIVFFALMLAVVAEILNTAIEITLDLQSGGKYHSKVKIAKDVAACSVLISLLNAAALFLMFFMFNLMGN